MLLSIDWDAYSGPADLVFDAPIWGTPDREYDRLAAWQARAQKRGATGAEGRGPDGVGADGAWADGAAAGWDVLAPDFPLYPGWEGLLAYRGLPCFSALSHADAQDWLRRFPGRDVLNVDSHHDLYSQSGDPARWRPGNWAGLGLGEQLIGQYTARYPAWHRGLLVAEGHDLRRTRTELEAALPAALLERVQLERGPQLPPAESVEALLLVQSPAWTSPAHDGAFLRLLEALEAQPLHGTLGGVYRR